MKRTTGQQGGQTEGTTESGVHTSLSTERSTDALSAPRALRLGFGKVCAMGTGWCVYGWRTTLHISIVTERSGGCHEGHPQEAGPSMPLPSNVSVFVNGAKKSEASSCNPLSKIVPWRSGLSHLEVRLEQKPAPDAVELITVVAPWRVAFQVLFVVAGVVFLAWSQLILWTAPGDFWRNILSGAGLLAGGAMATLRRQILSPVSSWVWWVIPAISAVGLAIFVGWQTVAIGNATTEQLVIATDGHQVVIQKQGMEAVFSIEENPSPEERYLFGLDENRYCVCDSCSPLTRVEALADEQASRPSAPIGGCSADSCVMLSCPTARRWMSGLVPTYYVGCRRATVLGVQSRIEGLCSDLATQHEVLNMSEAESRLPALSAEKANPEGSANEPKHSVAWGEFVLHSGKLVHKDGSAPRSLVSGTPLRPIRIDVHNRAGTATFLAQGDWGSARFTTPGHEPGFASATAASSPRAVVLEDSLRSSIDLQLRSGASSTGAVLGELYCRTKSSLLDEREEGEQKGEPPPHADTRSHEQKSWFASPHSVHVWILPSATRVQRALLASGSQLLSEWTASADQQRTPVAVCLPGGFSRKPEAFASQLTLQLELTEPFTPRRQALLRYPRRELPIGTVRVSTSGTFQGELTIRESGLLDQELDLRTVRVFGLQDELYSLGIFDSPSSGKDLRSRGDLSAYVHSQWQYARGVPGGEIAWAVTLARQPSSDVASFGASVKQASVASPPEEESNPASEQNRGRGHDEDTLKEYALDRVLQPYGVTVRKRGYEIEVQRQYGRVCHVKRHQPKEVGGHRTCPSLSQAQADVEWLEQYGGHWVAAGCDLRRIRVCES